MRKRAFRAATSNWVLTAGVSLSLASLSVSLSPAYSALRTVWAGRLAAVDPRPALSVQMWWLGHRRPLPGVIAQPGPQLAYQVGL